MGSRFLRQSFGPFASSPLVRGTRFITPRVSSLLLGITVAAGALLIVPQTPRAWAAPSVGGDENGPKVQILSPGYQDVLKGPARILVGVKATQFNPSTIQLFLDDKPASNVLPLSSFSSSSFNWNTRLTTDGPHKLSVRVTDTQGFRGWAEVTVYVNNKNVRDTDAPELTWSNVQPFQQFSGQAQIQLQAKDNFGVKWIIVSLNPVSKGAKQPAQHSWLLSKPPYSFDFDTTKVADGLYALSARAWDPAEQEGQSQMLTIGVVNSSINATTIGESLEGLKAMAQAERKAAPAAPAPAVPAEKPAPPKVNYVSPPPTQSADSYSGGTAKNPANTTTRSVVSPPKVTPKVEAAPVSKGGTALPPSFPVRVAPPTLTQKVPQAVAPPVEVAQNDATTEVEPPALSTPSTPTRLDGAPSTLAGNEPLETTTTENATRVARLSPPEVAARVEATPDATLSAPSEKATGDVLAPSRSTALPTEDVTTSAPVLVARLDTPGMAPREVAPDLERQGATLSVGVASTAGVVASARTPEASTVPEERVEIARLTLPSEVGRELEVAPVLSAANTSLASAVSSAQSVSSVVESAPTLIASAPGSKEVAPRASGMAKVKYQRTPHVVNKIADKTAPAKTPAPATTLAEAVETAADAAPQLSQNKTVESVVTAKTNVTSPVAKEAPRVARLPKADAKAVETAPNAVIQPAITVSPVQVAFNNSLPSFHQTRHQTTLRAIATHYGLPVELVAAANNWTTDMKVLPGMKVQLPRQVQLSYNGQKVRGDVVSLLAGDTTFTAMRFLFEHTGGTIAWDEEKGEVVARKGASTIRVKIGSKTATVNNKKVMMQLAAFLFEGRTMVPARFFEEGLDAQVEWNPQTGRLVVAMAG